MELSVSILNAKDRKETIKILNNTDIDYIHLDVMDGNFVSQKTLSYEEINELARLSEKKLDIHLMVSNPLEYINKIKDIKNIEYITIHLELDKDIKNILMEIKKYGYKAALSIKPNTNIKEIIPYLNYIDMILLMTVEPGLGGQPFIKESIERLKQIKNIINKNIKIEVDGGINNETIKFVELSDIAVVGSYITKSDNMMDRIKELKV